MGARLGTATFETRAAQARSLQSEFDLKGSPWKQYPRGTALSLRLRTVAIS
jgi:hypothetical protein